MEEFVERVIAFFEYEDNYNEYARNFPDLDNEEDDPLPNREDLNPLPDMNDNPRHLLDGAGLRNQRRRRRRQIIAARLQEQHHRQIRENNQNHENEAEVHHDVNDEMRANPDNQNVNENQIGEEQNAQNNNQNIVVQIAENNQNNARPRRIDRRLPARFDNHDLAGGIIRQRRHGVHVQRPMRGARRGRRRNQDRALIIHNQDLRQNNNDNRDNHREDFADQNNVIDQRLNQQRMQGCAIVLERLPILERNIIQQEIMQDGVQEMRQENIAGEIAQGVNLEQPEIAREAFGVHAIEPEVRAVVHEIDRNNELGNTSDSMSICSETPDDLFNGDD